MGGDGGQVIDRATMVRTKGYGLTKESGGRFSASLGEMNSYVQMVSEDRGLGALERHRTRMTTCWLSQQTLRDPVVACRLGNLYNKEVLINALLNKSIPDEISHIRALKDVKQCLITWKEAENEEGRRRMVCPVSRDDLDAGSSRAVVIWTSGAVISPKSLKELKLKECPVSNKAFDAEKDVIPLAPHGEDLEKLRAALPASRKRKAAAAAEGEPKAAAARSSKDPPAASAPPVASPSPEADSKQSSEVYKKLFNKTGEGMTGTRDVFGTPCYNRGSKI